MKKFIITAFAVLFIGAMFSVKVDAQTPHPFFPPNSTQMLWYFVPDNSIDSVWICAPNGYDWGTYTKPTGDLVIPADIPNTNYHVRGILSYAFRGCNGLRSVEVSDGISTIGIESFKDCTGMTDITFGKDISMLNEKAFQNCSGLNFIKSRAMFCVCSTDPIDVFEGVSNSIPVYIPCNTKIIYQVFWNYFPEDCFVEEIGATFNVSLSVNNSWQGTAEITEWGTCENPFVEITAIPNSGYHFEEWNDGNTENPRVVQLESDTSFVANFGLGNMYAITIGSEDPSMGYTVPDGTFNYVAYSSLSIEAIPNEGHHFVKWKEDGYTLNPRTIYVLDNATYTAVFTANTGVDESNQLSVAIHPNPTNGIVTIEAENIKHISISNLMGQLIFDDAVKNDIFEYDFSGQEVGVYLIRVETSNGMISQKVVVTR